MSDLPPKVQSLWLENFTAFEEARFDFCPGINVLIGANATGKSHVMKVIYTLLKICEIETKQVRVLNIFIPESDTNYNYLNPSKLFSIFQANRGDDFVHFNKEKAFVSLEYNNSSLELRIGIEQHPPNDNYFLRYKPENFSSPPPLIYLPTQEVLSINRGFVAAYQKRELPYDETYYDLSLALNALPLRKDQLGELQEIIKYLRKIIAGEQAQEDEVVMPQENGRFKFSLPEGELDAHLVAEGYRKIATLYYLLRNGSLTKDSILFWDEPEANLNPKLIVEVARVLRMLALAGMQIFVATHDYLLSHELSLLAEYPGQAGIDVKFFALYRAGRTAGVEVESAQTLAEIENNPILEEFAAHYDREAALFHAPETAG